MPKKKVNAYLAKRAKENEIRQDASRQTFEQYTWDCLCLVLNDNGFGSDRIYKIWDEWTQAYHKWFDVLLLNDRTDAMRILLDQELERVLKERFTPFHDRYSWLPKTKEEKALK